MSKKKKTKTKYDWNGLKQEFFASEYIDVAPFIRERLGKETDSHTHIAKKVKGWAEEKKAYEESITEEAREKAKKKRIEALRVKLEEVMASKKLSFSHQLSFLEMLGKILKGKKLTKSEKSFMKRFNPKTIDMITKWAQIELGEPTKISELGFGKDRVKKIKIEFADESDADNKRNVSSKKDKE